MNTSVDFKVEPAYARLAFYIIGTINARWYTRNACVAIIVCTGWAGRRVDIACVVVFEVVARDARGASDRGDAIITRRAALDCMSSLQGSSWGDIQDMLQGCYRKSCSQALRNHSISKLSWIFTGRQGSCKKAKSSWQPFGQKLSHWVALACHHVRTEAALQTPRLVAPVAILTALLANILDQHLIAFAYIDALAIVRIKGLPEQRAAEPLARAEPGKVLSRSELYVVALVGHHTQP